VNDRPSRGCVAAGPANQPGGMLFRSPAPAPESRLSRQTRPHGTRSQGNEAAPRPREPSLIALSSSTPAGASYKPPVVALAQVRDRLPPLIARPSTPPVATKQLSTSGRPARPSRTRCDRSNGFCTVSAKPRRVTIAAFSEDRPDPPVSWTAAAPERPSRSCARRRGRARSLSAPPRERRAQTGSAPPAPAAAPGTRPDRTGRPSPARTRVTTAGTTRQRPQGQAGPTRSAKTAPSARSRGSPTADQASPTASGAP